MSKSIRFSRNPQMEVAGFVVIAALTIPTIVIAAYGIAKLISAIF